MATPTYDLLDSVTLGSSASSVTFSGISGYADLVLVANCSTTSLQDVRCNINGNTSDGSYSRVYASGNGSSTFSGTGGPRNVTYYGAPASGLKSQHIVQFLDANATDKHKTYLTRSGRAGGGTDMIATRFASTSAITSIELEPTDVAVSFEATSTFQLFGVAK